MAESVWYPFDNGSTLGQKGSENGTILRDEEHPLGARITLERDGSIAPLAITCGIYGWMVHTRFFSQEAVASSQFGQMRNALADLLEKALEGDGGGQVLMDGVSAFVARFP
jgi:hypothetical protein